MAQLLTEIDGLGKRPGMFTIGATNRPDLLDSALLRTGRFDKMIYLGVAKSVEEKVKILEAQTRRLKLASDVDFADIAKMLPANFTGADFSALTSESYMIAVKERIEDVRNEISQYKNEQGLAADTELLPETYFKLKYPNAAEAEKQTEIEIGQKHLKQALGQITPSITLAELRKYEELRDKYSQ